MNWTDFSFTTKILAHIHSILQPSYRNLSHAKYFFKEKGYGSRLHCFL